MPPGDLQPVAAIGKKGDCRGSGDQTQIGIKDLPKSVEVALVTGGDDISEAEFQVSSNSTYVRQIEIG